MVLRKRNIHIITHTHEIARLRNKRFQNFGQVRCIRSDDKKILIKVMTLKKDVLLRNYFGKVLRKKIYLEDLNE